MAEEREVVSLISFVQLVDIGTDATNPRWRNVEVKVRGHGISGSTWKGNWRGSDFDERTRDREDVKLLGTTDIIDYEKVIGTIYSFSLQKSDVEGTETVEVGWRPDSSAPFI